jgi:hypothetical protein
VTGQEFSSKINDELTLFACNSGLQALQKCQPKTCPASPFVPRATRVAPQHIGNQPTEVTRSDRLYSRGDVRPFWISGRDKADGVTIADLVVERPDDIRSAALTHLFIVLASPWVRSNFRFLAEVQARAEPVLR